MVVVQKFFKVKDGITTATKLGEAVKSGEKFTVKCVLKKSTKTGGKDFFDLEDGESKNDQGIIQ